MRLFVAIPVGDEVRAAAAKARGVVETAFQRVKGPAPRLVWVVPHALHVTLRFLGEQPDGRARELMAAAEEPYPLPPFEITWRGPGAFPSPRRPRVIWLGATAGAGALGHLEQEVTRRFGTLATEDIAEPVKPFHPHLTLARVKIQTTQVDWPAVLDAAQVTDVASMVTHVSLFRSRGLPGGAGYEEIGRGRLDG